MKLETSTQRDAPFFSARGLEGRERRGSNFQAVITRHRCQFRNALLAAWDPYRTKRSRNQNPKTPQNPPGNWLNAPVCGKRSGNQNSKAPHGELNHTNNHKQHGRNNWGTYDTDRNCPRLPRDQNNQQEDAFSGPPSRPQSME